MTFNEWRKSTNNNNYNNKSMHVAVESRLWSLILDWLNDEENRTHLIIRSDRFVSSFASGNFS